MKWQFLLVLAITAGVFANPVIIDSDIGGDDEVDYRLDDNVRPEHYQINLSPYLENEGDKKEWTFEGSVKIKFHVYNTEVQAVVLHANELEIENIKLYSSVNPSLDLFSDSEYDEQTQKLTITASSVLAQDRDYFLEMDFEGVMRDDMAGFYRSIYTEDGQEKRMGSTQFQPTHARRVFPCFDEPKFKAIFQIIFNRKSDYTVISNTEIESSVDLENGFIQETFKETPKMSTYLVAFLYSQYKSRVEGKFGVWARPEMYDQTEYALDVGQRALTYFDQYTDYPYYDMIEKMDMAAVPDFSAGAMENWGLLTFRETALLYDPEMTTPLAKQRIAGLVIHEQAHMWFGDLVTCDWWGYTWLNEGFAQYHQYFSTAKVETEWDMDLQFIVEQLQTAYQMDASTSTHPMNHVVNTPGEISAIFDNISYNKGASVIRMIEHLMGSEKFQEAIQNYLKENEYQTTVPEKLYSALQSFADESLNIAQIMGSWADQEGFPVLQVTVNSERTQATISQKRFLTQNADNEDNTLYQIPITFANKNGNGFDDTSAKTILSTVSDTIDVFSENSWTIFNVQEVGFYRVNYDSASWRLIREALLNEDFDGIHVLNRAQIIDDALNLARGGLLKYETAFEILDYLDNEKHYIPWLSAFNGLSYLSRKLANLESSEFSQFILKKLENIYDHLGFYGKATDSQIDIYNRFNVLQWACKYGHEDCIARAQEEFKKAQDDDSYLVPVAIRQIVYCTGLRYGDANDWDWMWEKYEKQEMATEKILILNGLGCTADEESLNKYLDKIYSGAIRRQDQSAAFTSTYSGHDGNVDKIWNYIVNNHDKIAETYGNGILAKHISDLASRFTSKHRVYRLKIFIKVHYDSFGSNVKVLEASLSKAYSELKWASKYCVEIDSIVKQKLNPVNSLSAEQKSPLEKLYNQNFEDSRNFDRLPDDVVPIRYDIELVSDLEESNDQFPGNVKIYITSKRYGVNTIDLNIKNIDIIRISIYEVDTPNFNLYLSYAKYEEYEKLHVKLITALKLRKEYVINIDYKASFNKDMTGYYKSTYNINGTRKILGATQFEPTYARSAFPCFDEPSLKAEFQLTIVHLNTYSAISNTEIASVTKTGNWTETRFKKTQSMSTYLLAFVVSEFKNTSNGNLTVWARPAMSDYTKYALEVGSKLLKVYDNYTQLPYYNQKSKMDLVGVPDFAAGAMENWGLLTFKENLLLFDDKSNDIAAKQKIASVISHEQAHMWFGNLVTCEWWSYTWLNEGFAIYYQYFTTAKVETNWELENLFLAEVFQSALLLDSFNNTHALNRNVTTPSEIKSMFDRITYIKGASIIRMIELVMGSYKFNIAMQNYLRANQQKTTNPNKLYAELDAEWDDYFNISEIMKSWTDNEGYPVITVSFDDLRHVVNITQRRFILNNPNHNDETLYLVPISFAEGTADHPYDDMVLTNKSALYILGTPTSSWVILNVYSFGFYRVNYDDLSWSLIQSALLKKDFDGIPVSNRAQLVDDALNLARAGLLSYDIAIQILDYLDNEQHYLPWLTAKKGLTHIRHRYTSQNGSYFQYVQKKISNIYFQLGFYDIPNEPEIDKYNRFNIIQLACEHNFEDCINMAKNEFNRAMKNDSYVIMANRQTSYCVGVKHGGGDEWRWLWNKYEKEEVAHEKVMILNALGCTMDDESIEYYLKYILEGQIREQDAKMAFKSILNGNVENAGMVLIYITINYEKIIEDKGINGLITLITELANRITTRDQLNFLEEFIEAIEELIMDNLVEIESALELVNYNLFWASNNLQQIEDILLKKDQYRLSNDIQLSEYDLQIITNVVDNNFDGLVNIYLEVITDEKPLQIITLNSKDLDIEKCMVTKPGESDDIVKNIFLDVETQKLHIHLKSALDSHCFYNVFIQYKGTIRDDMVGLYRSVYNEGGKEKQLLATAFKPIYARTVFPCFDEPSFKTAFTLTVDHPKQYSVVSNAEVSKTEEHNETRRTYFKQTDRMSTYMLSLLISEFHNQKENEIDVWARPDMYSQTEYALSMGHEVLPIYEQLFHFYGTMSLALVAIPDLITGSVENWNLLMFREQFLLSDSHKSTPWTNQTIASSISQQLGRIWLGNMVTCEWWSDLWITEGLARYYQYFVLAEIEPDWNMDHQFVVDQLQRAFYIDSLNDTYKMNTMTVENPTEISAMFDRISSDKAASFMRMIAHLMEPGSFDIAIHYFVDSGRYGNTDSAKFFEKIYREQRDQSIVSIMESWANQEGYPVLHVVVQKNEIWISQDRFMLQNPHNNDYTIYKIPITYANKYKDTFDDTSPKMILEYNRDTIDYQMNDSWIIFNVQQVGYYRVNYDENSWARIIDGLLKPDFDGIHVLNRAQIVDDALNLARGGLLSYKTTFSILKYLQFETHYTPWVSAFNGFEYLSDKLSNRNNTIFRQYILKQLTNIYDHLGFYGKSNDTQLDIFNRANVLRWACKYGQNDCITKAKNEFQKSQINDSYIVPADIRELVYCTGLQLGTEAEWTWLWNKFMKEDVATEKNLILNALGCTRQEKALQKYVENIFSEQLRTQDQFTAFESIYRGKSENVDFAMHLLFSTYSAIIEIHGLRGFVKLVDGLANHLSTEEQVIELSSFIENSYGKLKSVFSELQRVLEAAFYEIFWASTHIETIENILQ